MMASLWVFLAHLTALTSAATIQYGTFTQANDTSFAGSAVELKARADGDPADFGWVKRWAAVGDSYTAGIGSGNVYSSMADDIKCSRYDHSYPSIVNYKLGGSVKNFQYTACSGDRSVDIIDQITGLEGGLDLVLMTAGGNDLCLSSIIKTCIFLPFQSDDGCEKIIALAQSNIDNILKPNIESLLDALNDKMNDDSVVIYNLYAQFFNADTDDCSDQKKQDFTMPAWLGHGLPLTKDRRAKFNTLSINANNALKGVVESYAKKTNLKYKITWSDWDPWLDADAGVSGRMCEPESSGKYPDPDQGDLQFFKPSSYRDPDGHYHDELKRDISPEMAMALARAAEDPYKTSLWLDPNPNAEVLHRLDKRAPSPPGCPGDGGFDWTFGYGLPDAWLKHFHPNEIGHETVAAFALEGIVAMRGEVLGVNNPYCSLPKDDFTCWQKTGSKAYASADRMNENYKDFCNNVVQQPSNTINWKAEKTYHEGTPDEHSFVLQLTDGEADWDKDDCLKSFDNIINSCDGNDPNNPMDWKFGGRSVKDSFTYEVNVKRTNRPWPPIKEAHGYCEGWWKVFFAAYKLRGAGWSTYDYGQQTLLPNIKGCLGLGVTAWKFTYFDEPDGDGNEWESTFNTPVFVRHRCFTNNKVAMACGGTTGGCGGNDG